MRHRVVIACGLAAVAPQGAAAEPPPPDAAATAEGEVIVVTGTKSETPRQASPVTIEVIDRKRLAESGAQTVGDALALRPGLWLDRGIGGGVSVSMQGLGSQYTLVLVDGARQIGRTDGVLDLDRFAVEDLEQIEIVRGPSSVLHGSDALGGVIQLVTRTPKDGLGGDVLARVDGRGALETRGRIAGGQGGYAATLTGSYRKAPAIRQDDDGTQVATTFAAYEDTHLGGRVTNRRGNWRLELAGDHALRDLQSVAATATGAVFDRRNLVESNAVRAAARFAGDETSIVVEAAGSTYRDQYLSDQRLSNALDQYQDTEESLVEGRVQVGRYVGAARRHDVLAGAEVLREALASDRLSMPGDRLRAAAFVQDEWRVGDGTIVVPAARVDHDSQFGTQVTPRIAARWQRDDERLVVRGSTGMGYRAPSFKELLLYFQNPGVGYVVEGNPDLAPETSASVQVGTEWRAASWLWLSGDAYYNRLRDMIFAVTRPADGSGMLQFSYANIGRARTAGFETYAIAGHGRAAIELGYAMTRTRDLDAERPLDGIPAHRFTATARWRDPVQRFDAFLAAVVTGKRPYFVSEDPQLATNTTRRLEIRARVAKRFSTGYGGFLGFDNLLDTGDAAIDPVPPRTVYAGVEAHF